MVVSGCDSVFGSSLPSSVVTGLPRAAVSIPGMDRTVVPATAMQTAPSCRNGESTLYPISIKIATVTYGNNLSSRNVALTLLSLAV